MQAEIKTMMRVRDGHPPELIMQMMLLPRGSGNKNKARRLAQAFKEHPKMKPHIKRVVTGSSSVTVHMLSSLALMDVLNEISAEAKAKKDVEGQLPLFGLVNLA